MTEKEYTVAGIAIDHRGNTKVRYANNLANRTKILLKGPKKCTEVLLIELNDKFDKFEACQLLLSDERFVNYKDTIHAELDRLNRLADSYSIKIEKKKHKLALANISANELLDMIK